MSITLHLRPNTAKSANKCVDVFRTRLRSPIRTSEISHVFRGPPRVMVPVFGAMDISSGVYLNSHAIHSSSYSEFRPSPRPMLPVRRRRRGTVRKSEPRAEDSTSEENDGTTTLERIHSPVTNSSEFDQASSRLLDKIETAMEPMKSCNEIFITKRADGELGEIFTIDLGPKIGIYQIEISQDEHVFEYSSPISGKLLYCLSSATGEWVNIDDGHQFEGILVRDLLRSNCIGLPNL